MEAIPRILILPSPEPGAPDPPRICKPATEPTKASDTLVVIRFDNSSVLTTEAEPVKADFFAVPKATTNTSSNISVSAFIVTFTCGAIATSCTCIPIYEICNVFAELCECYISNFQIYIRDVRTCV